MQLSETVANHIKAYFKRKFSQESSVQSAEGFHVLNMQHPNAETIARHERIVGFIDNKGYLTDVCLELFENTDPDASYREIYTILEKETLRQHELLIVDLFNKVLTLMSKTFKEEHGNLIKCVAPQSPHFINPNITEEIYLGVKLIDEIGFITRKNVIWDIIQFAESLTPKLSTMVSNCTEIVIRVNLQHIDYATYHSISEMV